MPTPPAYDIHEHRHRFAIWAAGRAAQRKIPGGSISVLGRAISQCGVRDDVRLEAPWHSNAEEFDRWHAKWCESIVANLKAARVKASFGQAAKLIAIYLKATVVIAGSGATDLRRIIHPPIDRILLKTMARDKRFAKADQKYWDQITWTTLDRAEYMKLIGTLRRAAGLDAFWMLESYWDGAVEK